LGHSHLSRPPAQAACTPTPLLSALSSALRGGGGGFLASSGARVSHLHLEGALPHLGAPRCVDVSYFCGSNVRAAVASGDGSAEYAPVALSALPSLLRRAPVDVALLTVSPPDAHGWCTLGPSVDASAAAAASARARVAVVCASAPATRGADAAVHVSSLDALVDGGDFALHTAAGAVAGLAAGAAAARSPRSAAVDAAIAGRVAALIADGDTLQAGIGAVPDLVLRALASRRGLRVHSEMIGDGVRALVDAGAVRGVVTASFAFGSAALYAWLHDNAGVVFRDAAVTNDACLLRALPRLVSVNGALEVDLTGQVCSDSIGTRVYSGMGGAGDFAAGAAASPGGKSIVALPSRTAAGAPRIVPVLRPGAGVGVTRAAVQFVVTEHGAALLAGATLRDRARALIDLAHPDDRAALDEGAHAAGLLRRA
jgi:acyl-CoA hydrolase